DTLEELKADLEKKIAEEKEKAAQQAFEDALMEQVAANITVEIPDAMIETQCKQYLENFKMQIMQQGIPYEDYMKMTGMDEAKLLEDAKEPAERQVRMDLAMAAIIKAENITASDEEVEAEYAKFAEQYSMDIEMVKKYLTADQIRDELISRKAVEIVTSSAKAKKARKTTKKTTKKAEKEAEKETEKDAE
ncbi:MAG: trigger factor, partial [Oscillibacter sp.]|nr:trigger factor [Oscillibacter sp.]